MNAYERRRKILHERRELRQRQKVLDRLEHVDKVMLEYEVAYRMIYHVTPVIEFKKGWFIIYNPRERKRKHLREADIQALTKNLQGRYHQAKLGGEDEDDAHLQDVEKFP